MHFFAIAVLLSLSADMPSDICQAMTRLAPTTVAVTWSAETHSADKTGLRENSFPPLPASGFYWWR